MNAQDTAAPRTGLQATPDISDLPSCGPPKPDARWRRACLLADYPAPGRGTDAWVRRARRFVRRMRRLADDPEREAKLAAFDADVTAAHAVYASADKLIRGSLEAWLLAGLSPAEAAVKCSISPGAAEAYHELFFDVRDRRSMSAWVVLNALGKPNLGDVTEHDLDVILKWMGCFGGRRMLQAAIDYYRHGCAVPPDLSAAGVEELERLQDRLAARAVILTWVLPFEQMHRGLFLLKLSQELGAVIDARRSGDEQPRGAVPWSIFGRAVEAAGTGAGLFEAVDPATVLEMSQAVA